MRRALALLQHKAYRNIENGEKVSKSKVVPSSDDPFRKASKLPFEREVFFLTLATHTSRNRVGELLGLDVGVATLDTRDLKELAPGPEGKNYAEEVREVLFQGRHSKCPLEFRRSAGNAKGFWNIIAMDEAGIGRLRRDLARMFEAPISAGETRICHSDCTKHLGRKVVIFVYDARRTFEDLIAVGINPRKHINVLDIVDIADLALANGVRDQDAQHTAGDHSHVTHPTPSREKIFSDFGIEDAQPQPAHYENDATGYARRANQILQAAVRRAFKNFDPAKDHGVGPGLAGGAFPGPCRTLRGPVDRIAYALERSLMLETELTAAEIERRVDAFVAQFRPIKTKVSRAQDDEARCSDQQAAVLSNQREPAQLERPSGTFPVERGNNTKGIVEEQHSSVRSLTGAEADLRNHDDPSTTPQTESDNADARDVAHRPETVAGAVAELSSDVLEAVRVLNVPPCSKSPHFATVNSAVIPDNISGLIVWYGALNRKARYTLCTVASELSDIDAFAKYRPGDEVSTYIKGARNYVVLAEFIAIRKKGAFAPSLCAELLEEIACRTVSDNWHRRLCDWRESRKHREFTDALRATYQILKAKIEETSEDTFFETRQVVLDGVEVIAGVEESAEWRSQAEDGWPE